MHMNSEIQAISQQICSTVECEKIYLFGSYAYGVPTKDSDYDFYVVLPNGGTRPLLAMQKIYGALSKSKMNIPVDILAAYRSQFEEKQCFATLERKVAGEGVLLYERDEYCRQLAAES